MERKSIHKGEHLILDSEKIKLTKQFTNILL